MQPSEAELKRIFPGDSEMAQRMRAFDWSKTAAGPVATWPQSLRTAISISLRARYPMFVWWGRQRVNFYNDAYIPVLGKRHPAVLGLPGHQVWEEIWDQLGAQSEQVLNEGRAVWCDQTLLVMERNGFTEETYFTYSYSPISDDDGNTNGLLCVCSEETQRVLSQRRLQTLRALGEAATAKSPQEACAIAAGLLADYAHDLPFVLLYLRDSSGQRADLAGTSGLVSGAEAAPAVIELGPHHASWPLDRVTAAGGAIELAQLNAQEYGCLPGGPWPESTQRAVILPMVKPGQGELAGYVIAGISPRLAFDDDYRGFLALLANHIATAVADAEAYEAEHKRVTALAELDRAKTTFFSNISHEFRTPLTLLLGPANDLLSARHGQLNEDALQQVGAIQRNAVRLQKLVNNLLDFSRIEAGRMQAHYVPTDLAALTAELASVFRSAIEKAGMRLEVVCSTLDEDIYVDRSMWEKIVLNLLSNALKYSLEGTISVTLHSKDGQAVLAVRDTGIGIAAVELPKLFNRFYRIKGARSRSEEGTGIGLAMVRELARLHGGEVSVESEPGRGSTFTVAIPVGHAHLPAEHVHEDNASYAAPNTGAFIEEARQWLGIGQDNADYVACAAHESGNDDHATQTTVLVADDNADMRAYLQRLLSRDYRVLLAADGRQALQLAREARPDLVLSDVMMPELDGFALLQALRGEPATSTMAVILLSARAGEEARIEGLRAGADDYLTKPFNAHELLARVSGMVALARARRETYELESHLRQDAEELNRLHQLGDRLLHAPTLQAALEEVLDTALAVMHAPMGNIQLYDADQHRLRLLVQRGFKQPFLDRFSCIDLDLGTVCAKTVQTAKRTVVENIRAAAEYAHLHEAAAEAGYYGVQSTPLVDREGRVLGVLSTHFDQPHLPSARACELLDIYARQAIDLIERLIMEGALRESEAKLKHELEAMNGLHALSKQLLDCSTLQTALQEVLRAIIAMLGASSGNVLLFDRGRETLKMFAHYGFDAELLSDINNVDANGCTPCTEAMRQRERLLIDNLQMEPLFAQMHELARQVGFFGVQSTPLINREGQVLGVISTQFNWPHRPAEQELRLLDIYASHAIDLIERLQGEKALRDSEAKLKHELDAMNRLHMLSNRLLAAPRLQAALDEVLDASMDLMGANMGSVQFYDAEQDRLKLISHRGYTAKFVELSREFPVSMGTPCSLAVRGKTRVLTENIQTDARFAHLNHAVEAGFFGVQCTPLINGDGKVLGIISSHFHEPHLPTGQELRMLDLYAHQAVNLIERLRAEEGLRANEARFRALAEASPALIWQLDAEGNLVYLNERYRTMLGLAPEDVMGSNWHNVLLPASRQESLADFAHSRQAQTVLHRRLDIQARDGRTVHLDTHALPWYDATGEFAGHIGLSVDITASVQAQHELAISNERLKLAIEGAGDGVWDWDIASGSIVRSERFLAILGYDNSDAVDTYQAWCEQVHPEDLQRVVSALDACLQNTLPSYICEYRVRCSNGDWKWLLSRAIVVERDAAGKPLRMAGTISDISEKRRVDETIWHHANFDALTGLPNRRLFRDRLNQEIRKSERTHLPIALFFIDLDQFKEVNDLLGHDIGDLLLADAAQRISACVRQSDTVARLGGDEFTAIVPALEDTAHVEKLAQTIIGRLAEPFQLGDEIIYLSASLGITLYPTDADTAEKLITNADQAMYAAKNAGRNQFSYFTRSMQERAHARMRLIADLRNALVYGQLEVHYQPIVDLQSGRIIKAEALLRWQHPQLGAVDPLVFIPLAEESGLIHEIGFWTFEQAALCSKKWSAELGYPFQISVNKSPVQLLSQGRKVNWDKHLEMMGLSGSNIAIEITEGVLLNASPSVINKLMRYRQAGIQMSIDDFGTGYSSMAYLKKFAIDYLKIDQSFIQDMTDNPGDLTIVRSVIVMAHELGIQVIAEGIETEEQKQILIESNCDFAQGFLFSEAVSADQFEQMLLANDIFSQQQTMFSPNTCKLIS